MEKTRVMPKVRELTDLHPLSGRRGNQIALFLDVDGTLIEFAESPELVTVRQEVPGLLARLREQTQGAVAFVSGRPLIDLDWLFPDLRLPAAGQHGAELRGGGAALAPPDASWQLVRDAARVAQAAHPRLLFEDKGRSIAIHFRRAPELAPVARWLALYLAGAGGQELTVQKGHYVEEIKPKRADKGAAIQGFLGGPPFAGRLPIFIGDDVTDEGGFRLVNEVGGVSIKVGGGLTEAHWRLKDPTAVIGWLEKLVLHLDRQQSTEGA
jgi:trehalose 6-phosphate phosphatase